MKLSKRPLEELDEDLEKYKVEEEIVSKQAEIAEKEAIIVQLKKDYGPNWRKILGLGSVIDLQTLRGFLKSAKKGMERAGTSRGNPLASPVPQSAIGRPGSSTTVLPPGGITRA